MGPASAAPLLLLLPLLLLGEARSEADDARSEPFLPSVDSRPARSPLASSTRRCSSRHRPNIDLAPPPAVDGFGGHGWLNKGGGEQEGVRTQGCAGGSGGPDLALPSSSAAGASAAGSLHLPPSSIERRRPGSSLTKELGLRTGATVWEFKAAYRRLARERHPDVAGAPTAADFVRIHNAYATLSERASGGWAVWASHHVRALGPLDLACGSSSASVA
ncbi:hypothetical protein PR202_ga14593 [Eleusine coracana subsp. coracana]|uniref:J domain-containing protein n=1 Tax=Eleusine coracana subsp. coracana TaxID=191504 RepID=A0AAV5CH42_ELECO|nr:hypothetical protein PR202_ga14593 [Eleusine coracana subsp. coracana]